MKRLALLSVALLLVISGCATAQHTPSVHQLQDAGEKYLAAGDTANALKYLTEAEQKTPSDPVTQYDLALAYEQRDMLDKAFTHFQNALKLKPAYPEALNAMGAVYARRGQYQLAQESFQKALNDPFYKTPQFAAYNLGSLNEKKGDIEKAMSDYQQAVKFDPQYGSAWFRIARILEQQHRSDEARHAYGRAIAASPDLAEAHLRYGIMSYQAGDTDAAINSLNRVAKLAPNTNMADEARMYLQKLSAAALGAGSGSSASSRTPPGEIEFITHDVPQQAKDAPPSRISPQAAPPVVQSDFMSSQSSQIQPENPTGTPAPAAENVQVSTGARTPAPVQITRDSDSKYIVQIGSFADREKAEEIQKSLAAKGYSASVKAIKDKVLGKVFVIQLQPVNNISRATTLKTQLGGEIEGEPVIIKAPSK